MWNYFEIGTLLQRRCFSNFSSGRQFVQPSGNILAILVEGHWRNTSVQIFLHLASGQRRDVIWRFSIFSSGGHLVQWSGTFEDIWISDRYSFSLFRSRSHPVAIEQVSAESDQKFRKRCQKLIFKMAALAAIEFSIGSFSYFVSTRHLNAHHQV